MGIDREGRDLENVDHDDAGRLVANAGQAFEFFERVRNFAFEFFDKCLRKVVDVHAFGVEESAGLDNFGNAVNAELEHFLWRIGLLKENFGHLVHANVSALGTQDNRDKHREWVRVI